MTNEIRMYMKEIKLSAIIIAKNAENIIKECLQSVSFCDEILIIDGGSTDNTNVIAEKFNAKIIKGSDLNFAEQRNIGLRHAKGQWILYVDTDERVSDDLKKEIIKFISPGDSIASLQNDIVAFKINRQNYYFGNHPWPKIEKLERLFKKSALKEWYGALHESAKVEGEVGELSGLLIHYTHQDLSDMVNKTNQWSVVEAELRFNHSHPAMMQWRFFRVMLTTFYDSYFKQSGWKAGTAGLVESIYQSFSMFVTYAKLWELQNKI
jgi:glycosyltransferase involved in cell wall biosynthesis